MLTRRALLFGGTALMAGISLMSRTTGAEGAGESPAGPAALSNLKLEAPIKTWDEAIPLGNGLTGGLLWGEGNVIRLSLDRGDLWDLRTPDIFKQKDWNYATIQRLVQEKNQAEISRLFDAPYDQIPYPTKLPGGRLELTFPAGTAVKSFDLDLAKAEGRAQLGDRELRVFFSACEPVAMMTIPGPLPEFQLRVPDSVAKLGYPAAKTGREAGEVWLEQEAALGLKYAVVVRSKQEAGATVLALAITSNREEADPLALARTRAEKALQRGYETLKKPHVAWWDGFWARSGVRVPDARAQQQYDLVQYFYGAASRKGAPPMPLQAVWTADAGTLPPWKGDFHHDLNTQLTYWAYLSSGRFEEGEAFLDFMWNLLPRHREFARDFYGTPGAVVPGVMGLDGQPLAGWSQYALSPTMGAWVAQAFYLHWRYTMDRVFLEQKGYPYCREIGISLKALLKPGADGKLKLPLSSSPEIHDNSLQAWMKPNTNFDLAILRWLYGALAEMASELGKAAEAEEWKGVLANLDPLAVEGEAGALCLTAGEPLKESHRHHSHLMAIHPLGTLTVDGTDHDRQVILASLDQLKKLGTSAWCGYSFSWAACLEARAGRAEEAWHYLDLYLKAFILRNGFHVNGDQTKSGLSNFQYRPFTLEGNFAASQAVHEMLMQSWGGTIRVFPALPGAWKDVSFVNLRAEGGFKVSAERAGGQTRTVRIESPSKTHVRLADPFGGKSVRWNRQGVEKKDGFYEVILEAGETLSGSPAE
ncbi:MAG TPA: glycoside hydrolase N-terminal domain-containing protein [Candidatus Sumerlaeota bacterium]|nr:glycoside hydrolase N-terminal domain-containing protein [Candidatus Sumerlaeota bacterium]